MARARTASPGLTRQPVDAALDQNEAVLAVLVALREEIPKGQNKLKEQHTQRAKRPSTNPVAVKVLANLLRVSKPTMRRGEAGAQGD